MKILIRAILFGIGMLILALPLFDPKAEASLAIVGGGTIILVGLFAKITSSRKLEAS